MQNSPQYLTSPGVAFSFIQAAGREERAVREASPAAQHCPPSPAPFLVPGTYQTSRCRGGRAGCHRRQASAGRTAPRTWHTGPFPTAPGRTSRSVAAGTGAPSTGSTSARCRGSSPRGLEAEGERGQRQPGQSPGKLSSPHYGPRNPAPPALLQHHPPGWEHPAPSLPWFPGTRLSPCHLLRFGKPHPAFWSPTCSLHHPR